MKFFQILIILVLAATRATAAVTVRVQPTPGGPQIHVNGKPIPPRFFFGSPRSSSTIEETWTQHAFEFTPGTDVKATGTMRVQFGQSEGEIWLADVRIVDAETGGDVLPPGSFCAAQTFKEDWSLWPPGEQNAVGRAAVTNGALQVSLTNPPTGAWPDIALHLQSHLGLRFSASRKYRVTFRAKATPKRQIYPAVYQLINGGYVSIGGPPAGTLPAHGARSAGDGKLATMKSSSGCTPRFLPGAPTRMGTTWRTG